MTTYASAELVDDVPVVRRRSPGEDPRAFATDAYDTVASRAPRLLSVLKDFAKHSNDVGCLLVRGLPGDPVLPPTGDSARKATSYSQMWLSAAGLALGQPVAFGAIKNGALFQDSFPKPEQSSTIASGNARTALALHSELFYHPAQPRWLLLYCLRGDRNGEAETGVASWRRIRGALERVGPDTRRVLWQRDFGARSDLAYRKLGVPVDLPMRISVLHGDPTDPYLRFDRDLTIPLTEAAAVTFETVAGVLADGQVRFRLVPNDLLVIDNWRTCHSRSSFTPYFDGADRWLQRIYVADPGCLTDEERRTWRVDRLPCT